MKIFTIITVQQEQLQLTWTLALFAENVLGGFDSSYDGVIGRSGVSKDGIVIHIHYIYLVFPSCWVQICCVAIFIGVDNIHICITDPESTIKDKNKQFILDVGVFFACPPFYFEARCYWLRFLNILFDVNNIYENSVQMSVTQYRPSVLQKHWSR